MSIFDAFGAAILPVANRAVIGAVNYAIADAGMLLNEGYSKVKSVFGGTAPFSGLNSGGPTFSQLSAQSAMRTIRSTDPYYSTASSLVQTDTSSVSASQINATAGSSSSSDDTNHKVKLTASTFDGESSAIRSNVAFPTEPLMERVVEFDIMPEVTENRTVEYEAMSPPQAPGEFQKYKGTKSTTWQIVATFTCRTRDEAKRNYIFLNTLRGWSQSYFGDNQLIQFQNKLGAPPPVLTFSGWRGLVGAVPVVLTSTSWNWPKDCDWLPTGIIETGPGGFEIPFPAVMSITISLTESFSAQQFNAFDLVAFRNGDMVGAFGGTVTTADTVPSGELAGPGSGLAPGNNGTTQNPYGDDGSPPDQTRDTSQALGNTDPSPTDAFDPNSYGDG